MLSLNHTLYVMHNVICWKRSYSPKKLTIKAIAEACYKYDSNYSQQEYAEVIKENGLKTSLSQI